MFKEIFILSEHGEKIFIQNYIHTSTYINSVEIFNAKVLAKCHNGAPFLKVGDLFIYFIKREDVFICGLVDSSQDSLIVITVLDRIFGVLSHFLTGFNAALCMSSRPLLIEILTECLDGGFVMLLEPKKLQSFIFLRQHKEPGIQCENVRYQNLPQLPKFGEGLDYGTHEKSVSAMPKIYIDIIEVLRMEISSKESIKTSKISGTLNVKCSTTLRTPLVMSVSNVPDKLALQSTAAQLNTDAILLKSAIRGTNRVLTYEMNNPLRDPPILISVRHKGVCDNRSEIFDLVVKIISNIKEESEIINLSVDIPLPSSVSCLSQIEGEPAISFDESSGYATWHMKRIMTSAIESTFRVSGTALKEEDFVHARPVKASFEVSNYVWSGFSVDSVSFSSQQSVTNPDQFIRFATLVQDCAIYVHENGD